MADKNCLTADEIAEVIQEDFKRLKKTCHEMKKRKIRVGIVGEADSDVLAIANAHEYGTDTLPERSFIRASFDAEEGTLEKIVEKEVDKVLSNRASPEAAANSIGAQAVQITQNYIDENKVLPKVSDARQKQKTQYTTLYETGTHIRDRISYEIGDK